MRVWSSLNMRRRPDRDVWKLANEQREWVQYSFTGLSCMAKCRTLGTHILLPEGLECYTQEVVKG